MHPGQDSSSEEEGGELVTAAAGKGNDNVSQTTTNLQSIGDEGGFITASAVKGSRTDGETPKPVKWESKLI